MWTTTKPSRVNNFASKTNFADPSTDPDDVDDDDIQIFTARKQNISLNANEIVQGCICKYRCRNNSEKWVNFFCVVFYFSSVLIMFVARERFCMDWLDFYWLPSYLCMTYNNCNLILFFSCFNCASSTYQHWLRRDSSVDISISLILQSGSFQIFLLSSGFVTGLTGFNGIDGIFRVASILFIHFSFFVIFCHSVNVRVSFIHDPYCRIPYVTFQFN